jgi:hypothetical protein
MRARRLTSVAAIAAASILALSACRSNPTVAAYVGDQEITEKQVTEIIDDLRQKVDAVGVELPTRDDIVAVLVMKSVCEQLSEEKGYRPRSVASVELAVQVTGMPADSTYVQHYADLETCLSGLPNPEPTTPTEDELNDLVTRAKETGVLPADLPYDEAAKELDGPRLHHALGQRKVFTEAIADYDITVNPRYRPLEFPLLSFRGGAVAVGVPIGEDASEAVVDRN